MDIAGGSGGKCFLEGKNVGSILKDEVCWRGRFCLGFSSSMWVQESIKFVYDCHNYCAVMMIMEGTTDSHGKRISPRKLVTKLEKMLHFSYVYLIPTYV